MSGDPLPVPFIDVDCLLCFRKRVREELLQFCVERIIVTDVAGPHGCRPS